jgi:glycosyltransferase involved in cell wall biosynthesis
MPPLVSILIPAYNAGPWVRKTIESALAQTWPETELIIVDDGSTDDTLAIAKGFESARVKVIAQRNQGAATARNTAFKHSQGAYIQWLDADDLLSPEKISSQMAAALQASDERVLFSCPWAPFLYRVSRAKPRPSALWCDLPPFEWILRKMANNLSMQTGTWLVSRSLTEKAGPWNAQLLGDDDGEYFSRVLLQAKEVRFIKDGMVYWRMSGTGRLSHIGASRRKLEAQLLSMRLHIESVRSVEDSPRVRAACLRYIETWQGEFYPNAPDLVAELEAMARDLGGELKPLQLPWKYEWIKRLFNIRVAKRVQSLLPQVRWSLERSWEKALSVVGQ